MTTAPSAAADTPAATSTQKEEKPTKKKEPENELSEEDQQLKTDLEMLVLRIQEADDSLYMPSLETLRSLIRSSTSSMTAVPKPLKFLRPHYETLKLIYEGWPSIEAKLHLADVISILAMTFASTETQNDCLRFYLRGTRNEPWAWGHEYMRHLASEIGREYNLRIEEGEEGEVFDLMDTAHVLVPYFLQHNAEAEAVDLLLELENIEDIVPFLDKDTYERVCMYIQSCVNFLPSPDDKHFLRTAHTIYRTQNKLAEALKVSIRLSDMDMIRQDWNACSDPTLKKQMAFLLARQRLHPGGDDLEEELNACLCNANLSSNYLQLAKDLDVLEPKLPEDIYKSYLENIRPTFGGTAVEPAKQNLANTFVNCFLNVGYGNDKLILGSEDSNAWIYRNKDQAMMTATASIGVIMLWNVELGLSQIDKYMYSDDENIKAGALLAVGIINSGIRNDSDPALALLSEFHAFSNPKIRMAAIMGLGIAYAGTCRQEVLDLLLHTVADTTITVELSAIAALALGQVFAASANGDIASTILQVMMEREEAQLKEPYGRFLALGLALLFIGRQEDSDATIETLKAIEAPIGQQAEVLVQLCAYAGTGNVLKVQEMLHLCTTHIKDDNKGGREEEKDDLFQTFAVIAIAAIAMGEDIGADMCLRTFNHLMYYGEKNIKKAVPLALALLCASNPQFNVLETLSKYSHDNELEVAVNSIFAMGLVGAGTNNARLAQMLRQLAMYYHRDPQCLFVVRLAQGLVHMGKGTVSIQPWHSGRTILSPVAFSGILTTLICFTEAKKLILGNSHHLLFHLVSAIYPRFLITLDENLANLPVTARVGQAVDVVGQAGRPKSITGFQTHTTPVLLAYSERAELATDEYVSLSPDLEGFVILRKNPDYIADKK